MRDDFLLLFTPLVATGLNAPPLGIQHVAWAASSYGFRGKLIDLNIKFCQWLISDAVLQNIAESLPLSVRDRSQIDSLLKAPARLRISRSRAIQLLAKILDKYAPIDPPKSHILDEWFHCESMKAVLANVRENRPGVVGFSILCREQLRFATRLSAAVVDLCDATIVFGGPELAGWPRRELEHFLRANYIQHVVLGDGEEAFTRILTRNRQRTGQLPEIIEAASVPLNSVSIDASFLLSPNEYAEPRQFNIMESKGCYWNRCTHCDYIALHPGLDFSRNVPDLVSSMVKVGEETGVFRFHLVNDSLPPARARQLAAAVQESGSPIKWNCFVKIDTRFDHNTLAALPRGGCEYLVVGVESLEDKGLRVLRKGYSADEALKWLVKAGNVGVGLALNFMVGIPGTTNEDDAETLRRLAAHPELAAVAKVFRFVLSRSSIMGTNPGAFGLRVVRDMHDRSDLRGGSSMLSSQDMGDALETRVDSFRAELAAIAARVKRTPSATKLILALDCGLQPFRQSVQPSEYLSVLPISDADQSGYIICDFVENTQCRVGADLLPNPNWLRSARPVQVDEVLYEFGTAPELLSVLLRERLVKACELSSYGNC